MSANHNIGYTDDVGYPIAPGSAQDGYGLLGVFFLTLNRIWRTIYRMALFPSSPTPGRPSRSRSAASPPQADSASAPSRNLSADAVTSANALTVAQAAALIKDVLTQAMPARLRIVGEISNFSNRTHWFFSIKDDDACLRCVCFATAARRVGFTLRDGMQVVITGRVDLYEAQGNLQIYVDAIEPVGQGVLELRFRQLCEELRKLGYFDDSRRKALPALPQRIAVVTSKNGAALQDVINTAAKRWDGCELFLLDVLVQGASAAPSIAQAIRKLSRDGANLGIDAILLTRGGGSMEDLWAFNERVVADAIYDCSLPIVAAIGHECDTTIAELVADLRCSTPTQAAMTLIPDQKALRDQIEMTKDRLNLQLRRRVEHAQQRVRALQRHVIFRRSRELLNEPAQRWRDAQQRLRATLPARVPQQMRTLNALRARLEQALKHRLTQQPERLDALSRRLQAAVQRRHAAELPQVEQVQRRLETAALALVRNREQALEALSRQLFSIGPAQVLSRGFSYTLGPDGRVVRSHNQVQPGDAITTVLQDGKLDSRVIGTPLPTQVASRPCVEPPALPPRRPKKSLLTGRGSANQMNLFPTPTASPDDPQE